MNKTQKVYVSLALVSLVAIFFLPMAVLLPQVLPHLSEPSNPTISLFYLAEGFAFFALAFLLLALMETVGRNKKTASPAIIFAAGLAVIYAGHAKILCDLNETNFFVYLAGILLIVLAGVEKVKK
jgi:hypothetical protein